MADQVRAHVLYSGYVQGVGFRFTTQLVARNFDITGFVRNLPDGRVELSAEGPEPEVSSFLSSVSDRMRHHISKSDVTWHEPTHDFEGFEIRY